MTTPRDRLQRFLEHLDAIFGTEPEFHPFPSTTPGAPQLVCMVYREIPEAGHITGVTFGLSEVEHPDWKLGRPELTISLASTDVAWPLAIAELANRLRGECPFCYGNVINFGGRISEESEMSAFFLFAPSILEKESYLNIDLGRDLPIHIAGVYPIYDIERATISDLGLEKFWHHPKFDPYDVKRRAIE